MGDVEIVVTGGDLSREEQEAYLKYVKGKNSQRYIKKLEIIVDGDYVDLRYTYSDPRFERIRRITGYLVGTLDRFNDGKRAEVADRVKHGISLNLEQI